MNAKDDCGATSLHEAALYGDKAVVELLIAKGADVNFTDNAGLAPLKLAEEKGAEGIIALLKKHGA